MRTRRLSVSTAIHTAHTQAARRVSFSASPVLRFDHQCSMNEIAMPSAMIVTITTITAPKLNPIGGTLTGLIAMSITSW